MNTKKSQDKIQTPKYKVGDKVWVIAAGKYCGKDERVFAYCTITVIIYSRKNGKSIFRGYYTTATNDDGALKEKAVFATREEAESYVDKLEAEAEE